MRLVLIFLLLPFLVIGQYNPLQPPNTFQHSGNPHYWKHKKPHGAYWQQDVYYQIKADLDDQEDVITGSMLLEYTNNSPDELDQLVFHLYQNAFEPGSYAAQLMGRGKEEATGPVQKITVSNVTVNQRTVEVEQDNTILHVKLDTPLKPGEKAEIECAFETRFGKIHGRMKVYSSFGFKHFNVVHWYPRISVYDQKFGWTTDQHFGHEFYGDFGAFDVEISLPGEYILDATGNMLNRPEMLPNDLMAKLDVANFKDKPWNEAPSEIIPKGSPKKTWKFHAENVHDFAWTADPTYRIGKEELTLENGHRVMCIALSQEQHASGWQNAAAYTKKVIDVYAKDIGSYAYHKMIVADARDGMEYPMLTLDGGKDPKYRGLIAHEVGHNWFFGMVGNNETYRAALDEGFTQFLTSWALEHIEGDTLKYLDPENWLDKRTFRRHSVRQQEVYRGYYRSALKYDELPALNVHSDHFEGRYQYGQVYNKTATMLYNLQYTLGDELFNSALQHYFDQWSFCHPYLEDFRQSIISYTGVDLNWFFDEWLTTDHTIDYAVKHFRRKGEGTYQIKLKRKGISMPLDITLYDEFGKPHNYHIPNTDFVKKTDATVLAKWYGWGDFNSTYKVDIEIDKDISSLSIDPTQRLADVYQLNNHSTVPVSIGVTNFKYSAPHQTYEVEWNPLLWYNGYDGTKFGVEFRGDYWETHHKIHAKLFFNTGIGQQSSLFPSAEVGDFNRLGYHVDYKTPLRAIAKRLSIGIESSWIDGLAHQDVHLVKELPNRKTAIKVGIGSLFRPKATDLNYLYFPTLWNAEKWNNYANAIVVHQYRYGRSKGRIRSELRNPFMWSDYNYGYLNLSTVNDNRFYKLNLRTRVFAQYGLGDNWAPESQLMMAGANAEEMMKNPLNRALGVVPISMYGLDATLGNYQVGGGLNLRGYNNYLIPEFNEDSLLRFGFAGMSGAAFNTELEFDDLVSVGRKLKRFVELKTYLFGDAGVINTNRPNEDLVFSKIRVDAGVGATLEIKRWGSYSKLKPLKLRADFPLFLNRPPAGEEYLAFRWLIGFERAF